MKLTDFILKLNNENIYPIKSKIDKFVDLGIPYKEDKIPGSSENNYILIYELGEKYVRKEYRIKVLDSIDYSAGDIKAKYKNIKIKPTNLNKVETIGTYKQSEKILLKESLLGESIISVNSYNITDTYRYNYNFYITADDCRESTDIVTPDYKAFANATLIVLDYELALDENSYYYKNSKANFFSQFIKLRYTKGDKTEISNIKNITPSELDGKAILQVDSNIKGSQKLELLIRVRNIEYIVTLK